MMTVQLFALTASLLRREATRFVTKSSTIENPRFALLYAFRSCTLRRRQLTAWEFSQVNVQGFVPTASQIYLLQSNLSFALLSTTPGRQVERSSGTVATGEHNVADSCS
jgi:hypothetical protein